MSLFSILVCIYFLDHLLDCNMKIRFCYKTPKASLQMTMTTMMATAAMIQMTAMIMTVMVMKPCHQFSLKVKWCCIYVTVVLMFHGWSIALNRYWWEIAVRGWAWCWGNITCTGNNKGRWSTSNLKLRSHMYKLKYIYVSDCFFLLSIGKFWCSWSAPSEEPTQSSAYRCSLGYSYLAAKQVFSCSKEKPTG